jgi:hypothetical protein
MAMKPEVLLAGLEKTAEELAVKVSYESLRASVGLGGLCRVKGQFRIIIDKKAGLNERIATLAQALSRFDLPETEGTSNEVRELVQYYAMRRAS